MGHPILYVKGDDGKLYPISPTHPLPITVPGGVGGGGLAAVATQDSPTVAFTGDGTVGAPLTADASDVGVVTEDSATVTFAGTGTVADPLTADAAGGGGGADGVGGRLYLAANYR